MPGGILKILLVTDNFPPETNAGASRVFERALYWKKWGSNVQILTSNPNFPQGKLHDGYQNKPYQFENYKGLEVHRVWTFISANRGVLRRILDFLSFMFSAIFFGLFLKKPDVVVANSPQFFCSIAGWILSKWFRVPFVLEIADIWPASVKAVGAIQTRKILGVAERLELFMYSRAHSIVALTLSFIENLTARGVPPEKIHVVINGVELSFFKPTQADPLLLSGLDLNGKFVVGYIGTMGMAHGLENAIRAVSQLGSLPIHLLFVGPGAEEKKLKDLVTSLGLKNVSFCPAQPKERILEYWALCDVALVHLKDDPVFAEVIPSKIFEAMAMSLPLILVSPDGQAREILEHTGAGIWVPSGQPDQLAKTIRRLYEEKDVLHQLEQKSLSSAKLFTRERQAREMLDVLTDTQEGRQHDLGQ